LRVVLRSRDRERFGKRGFRTLEMNRERLFRSAVDDGFADVLYALQI